MIDMYIKEFIAIVKKLKTLDNTLFRNGCMYADKELVFKMLNKNAYETAENKLKVWRDLRWIDTDDSRLTSRIRIDGELKAFVKISIKTYEKLVYLSQK